MENRSVLNYCSRRLSSFYLGPRRRCALVLCLVAVSVVLGCAVVLAAGPWKAQVVDAEAGSPLQGVVVVAKWLKESPGFIHFERRVFDVDELVTDADGRFTIPARDTSTWVPGTKILGPIIHMFKGGYGDWRFREIATSYEELDDVFVRQRRNEVQWRKFLDEAGVVIQLPQLKSREERIRKLRLTPSHCDVPVELTAQWIDAFSRESMFLGLPPLPGKP